MIKISIKGDLKEFEKEVLSKTVDGDIINKNITNWFGDMYNRAIPLGFYSKYQPRWYRRTYNLLLNSFEVTTSLTASSTITRGEVSLCISADNMDLYSEPIYNSMGRIVGNSMEFPDVILSYAMKGWHGFEIKTSPSPDQILQRHWNTQSYRIMDLLEVR